MDACRLCLKQGNLCKSHIVPEFLYSSLYSKRRLMGITGVGPRGWGNLQQGIRERLLCSSCEQLLNELYEKPFKRLWIDNPILPRAWNDGDVHQFSVNHETFKLFHLSVFFRASVSTLPTYSEFSAPEISERLRVLVLNNDAGFNCQFSIFGYGVVWDTMGTLIPLVSKAVQGHYGGQPCWGMIYGGVFWWLSVSPHRNRIVERIGLRRNGQMSILGVSMRKVGVIQDAARALRRSKT